MATVERERPRGAAPPMAPDPSVRRRVLTLAAPVIGENLLQTIIGIVDTLFVSRLGADALAGVGTAIQVLFFLISALSAVVVGSSILVAQAIGARELERASQVARQAVLWSLVLALPLAALGWRFAGPLVAGFGTTPAVARIATAYLRVVLGAIPVLVLAFACAAVLRGAGDTRTPLYATLVANAVNALAAWALIFGHLGLPALGATGSAWAATLGRTISAALLLAVLFRGRAGVHLRGRSGWRPRWSAAREILHLGVPAAVEQVLITAAFTALTILVARLGTDALAASRVVGNAMAVSFLPGFGFSVAATTLVGQSVGAGTPGAGRAAALEAMRWAVLWMGAVGVLYFAVGGAIVRAFSAEPAVVQIGADSLRAMALFQPVWAVGIVLSGALRGMGDTRFPLLANAAGMWASVLLAAVVVGRFGVGLPGAWLCFAAVAPFGTLAVWGRFRRAAWRQAPTPVGIAPPGAMVG